MGMREILMSMNQQDVPEKATPVFSLMFRCHVKFQRGIYFYSVCMSFLSAYMVVCHVHS